MRLQFALLHRLIFMRIKVFRNLACKLHNTVTRMYFYLTSIGPFTNKYDITPSYFHNFLGDTLNFVGKSSEDINITKERGIAEESSAGKAEEVRGSSHKFDDEMVSSGDSKEPPKFEKFVEVSLLEAEKVDCCSVVSPVNDSVDHGKCLIH